MNSLIDNVTAKSNYVGRAFCSVMPSNPEFKKGMRGALITVVCRSESLKHAVEDISAELSESLLSVEGFEYIFNEAFIDRELSGYEELLIERLASYPVQFENVHYFKPDS